MTIRVRPPLIVLGLTAIFVYVSAIYILLIKVLVVLRFNDFGKFYLSVQQFRHGHSLYAANVATLIPLSEGVSREFLNLNPPHFHLLVLPFAFFPEPLAYMLWMAFNGLLMLASWRAIQREHRLVLNDSQRVMALLFFVCAAPTLTWIVTGQLSGILVALVTVIWIEARHSRWLRCGAGIGLACALKIFFAPLAVFLLLSRRWGSLISAASVMAAVFGVGMVVFGVREYVAWIGALSAVNWQWPPMNASATAPFVRVALGNPLEQVQASFVFRLLMIAASGGVLIVGLYTATRTYRLDDAFSVLLLTCLLASPLGWMYYHWVLAGPASSTFRRPGVPVLVACAALLVPFVLLYPWPSRLFAVSVGSLYSWSMLTLWFVAVSRARRPGLVNACTPAGLESPLTDH